MKPKKNIYFVGIGGIGMSALARFYIRKGYRVAGYDLTSTSLTRKLEAEGIEISYADDVDSIPSFFQSVSETLVVYTPAIPAENNILAFFNKNRYEIIKRASLLGRITQFNKGIAVAGTHGKTSISTFTAHLLYQSKVGCNAFLGGISANYNTNLLFNEQAQHVVIEADEFDRSFLELNPSIALISSMDADHLDIYGTHENVIGAFKKFAHLVFNNSGQLVVHLAIQNFFSTRTDILTYGLVPNADFHPTNVVYSNGLYAFDLKTPNGIISKLELYLAGTYNFENAVASAALAILAGIDEADLRKGLLTLKGVERRFEILMNEPVLYIDDYAHHPTEVKSCIESARAAFPDRHITVAFQPHLYSRTKDFYSDFSKALNQADFVFLLPIYPAREKPIDGVSSSLIYSSLPKEKCAMVGKKQLMENISLKKPDLFISMGAGDIGHWVSEFKTYLSK